MTPLRHALASVYTGAYDKSNNDLPRAAGCSLPLFCEREQGN
jgi:hypothetical protein